MREVECDFWQESNQETFIGVGHLSRRELREQRIDRNLAAISVGRNVCFGGKGGGGSAPAADPNIGAAAMKNAQVGEDWLKFAREQFATGNVRQDAMDDLTKKVINSQLDTQEQQSQWAIDDRNRWEDKFLPLQDEFINTAKNYDSQSNQESAAAEARADVERSAATQQMMGQRQMASMGVSPASGRFMGINRSGQTDVALASAGAQNNARQMVRDRGVALRADAINLGNGLPSQSAAAAGLGLNAGNSATGNSNQANANWRSNVGIMGQGFGAAQQGYANQANILNDLYGNQLNAWKASQQAGFNSAAGFGGLVGTVGSTAAMYF